MIFGQRTPQAESSTLLSERREYIHMKEFWNERYAIDSYVYGTYPNAFFKAQIDQLTPGKVLLPGEGEGRNAVYAASEGWDVFAFDSSIEARKKALRLATEYDAEFNYAVYDLNEYPFPENMFDAVGLVYFHLPASLRIRLHHSVAKSLKPGGKVILEAFHPEQLHYKTGGPGNPDMLYTSEMLREDFRDLSIQLMDEIEWELNEGMHHRGKAFITRFVAIKTVR